MSTPTRFTCRLFFAFQGRNFYKAFNETPKKGKIVNKDRLTKIKSKLKKHAPEILFGAFAVSMTTAYAIFLKSILENEKRFPEGGTTALALNKEAYESLGEGGIPYWTIDGHEINIAYDPDC